VARVAIPTGHRATTRLARNIPRAVAISKEGWGGVHQRQAAKVEERQPKSTMKKPRLGENRGLGFWRWHLYC
jgi:hypothetical protein